MDSNLGQGACSNELYQEARLVEHDTEIENSPCINQSVGKSQDGLQQEMKADLTVNTVYHQSSSTIQQAGDNNTVGMINIESLTNNSMSMSEQCDAENVIGNFDIDEFDNSVMNKHADQRVNNASVKSEQLDNQVTACLVKGGKSDNVNDFFDSTIHAPSLTSEDMPNAELDIAVFDRDSLKRLALEKMSEEKTVFSENLGLIPADMENKVIKSKHTTRGVLTRKGFEDLTNIFSDDTCNSTDQHKHPQGVVFRCGACEKTFSTICKLHDHLQIHTFAGSYHFDNILKIAFPKYDTVCMSTQTGSEDDENDQPRPEVSKSRGPGRPRKFASFGKDVFMKPSHSKKETRISKKSLSSDGVKRKRGRPRKNTESIVKKIQSISLDDKTKAVDKGYEKAGQKIVKLKIKTEDGGNTWKEVTLADTNPDCISNTEDIDDGTCMDESEVEYQDCAEACDIPEINVQVTEQSSEGKNIKKNRKRKMSIPRKVVVKTNADGVKIVNSRHKTDYKITCDLCQAKFQYTRGLIRHEMEKHADEMKFECDVCDMKFMRQYNLDRHKLCTHTMGKCRGFKKKGSNKIVKDKTFQGTGARSPDLSVACEVCGKMVPESKMEIHTRIHTGDRPYICHVCGKGLISDKKLKRHLLIHSHVNRHTCDVCGQGFSMKYKLRTHMFQHTGHKPYLCSVCGAEFNNSTSLLHHHRTQHLGDKRFECNICGGRYGKKSQLDEHMFSHSDVRTHVCKFCSKAFKHAKSLRRHEATHISDEKFACDQCDSKFSRKDNLERHKMCHIEVSLHCRFCRKKFRDSKPLLEHEQNHINQKRFTCRLCKERFQNETYFNNHIEKVHQLDKDSFSWDDTIGDNEKDDKEVNDDIQPHNIVLSAMKMSAVPCTEQTVSMPFSGQADTLNVSMNVAGILPTSVQDLLPSNSLHTILVSHNSTEGYNTEHNAPSHSLITARNMLNQSLGQTYVSSSSLMQLGPESQRPGLMNVENGTLRLSVDPSTDNLTLSSTDNMIIHEQQRLMQETLGSSLNMQNAGYRMQNMF